jgi:hypothetical protein
MCKWQRVIPRHKGSPRYRIAHGWKNEFGSFNLESLKFLMHFRELGSSLYFIFISYILIYIFSFLIFFFLYTHFFLFLSFFFFFFFSFSFSILPPFELYNYIVPTSSPMLRRLLVLEQRGDRDKVGTENSFPSERYLKSETTRISANGNPNLSTSVVVPGGLPRAIPVSAMP